MRKKIAVALTAGVAAATVGLGAGAVEARPANAGAACVQDGIGFLKANNLLRAAAKKQIDYSTLGPGTESEPGPGLIRVQLEEGSFLSLGQFVKLHVTSPQIFTWCD